METRRRTEYLEGRVRGASSRELITLLYDIVLEEVRLARNYLWNNDPLNRSKCITKAVQGLTEMILSLDMEKGGSHSLRLREVYGYLQNELLAAHGEKSDNRLAKVAGVLGVMRQNWRETCALLNPEVSVGQEMPKRSAPERASSPWSEGFPGQEASRAWEG